jgi:exopolysaccharide biosynthesis protein
VAGIGGSPLLLQAGSVRITDVEELININNTSSRPRTAIGYTAAGRLVLLAVEGDNASAGYPGINLVDLANLLKSIGCTDAINLDGGGSTSMVIGSRLTVRPGDNGVERPVTSAVLIKQR